MTDAVSERGEIMIELDGTEYKLRPSLEALKAVERELTNLAARDNPNFEPGAAVTMQSIMNRLWPRGGQRAAGLRIEEYGIIIYHAFIAGAKADGNALLARSSREKIEQLVFEKGPINCLDPTVELVANWLGGGAKKKQDGETPDPETVTTDS